MTGGFNCAVLEKVVYFFIWVIEISMEEPKKVWI